MIDSYLAGTLPTLTAIPLEEAKPACSTRCVASSPKSLCKDDKNKKLKMMQTFANNQDLLDTLWDIFRHRIAHSDRAHHADAALEQEPRHHRQADDRQHGALHARKLRVRDAECASFSAAS